MLLVPGAPSASPPSRFHTTIGFSSKLKTFACLNSAAPLHHVARKLFVHSSFWGHAQSASQSSSIGASSEEFNKSSSSSVVSSSQQFGLGLGLGLGLWSRSWSRSRSRLGLGTLLCLHDDFMILWNCDLNSFAHATLPSITKPYSISVLVTQRLTGTLKLNAH